MKPCVITGVLVAACAISVLLAETEEGPEKKLPGIPGITTTADQRDFEKAPGQYFYWVAD